MSTMVMPVVGNKIKAVRIPLVTGTESDEHNNYTGQIVTITTIGQRTWSENGETHTDMTVPYARFLMKDGGTQEFFISEWAPVFEDTETPAEPASEAPAEPELTEDRRTIAALKTTIGDLQDMIRKLTHDIEVVIGETINNEADERGWCETFDNIVEYVNNRLTGCARLPERVQEFEVERCIMGTVTTMHTVTVMARSQDDAENMVDDCPSDYFDADEVLTEYISWNSFDNIEIESA
jgi:hypothetical protein